MSGVLLLGGDTDFNLGDRAILRSVCAALSGADRRLRLTVMARRGGAPPCREAHSVIPRGPSGLVDLLRAARRSALVGIAGGGLFQDDDSRIKMPFWAARLGLLRGTRTPVVGHAIGAGPLRHAESRFAARLGCAMLSSISVRDRFAWAELSGCTDRSIRITPDPAFMLDPASAESARSLLRDVGLRPGRPLIGVVLRRWFHKRGGFVPHRIRTAMGIDRGEGQAALQDLIDQVAAAVRGLARELDAAVLLLPSYNVGHEADDQVARQLQSALAGTENHLLVLDDPARYKAVTGMLSLLVSARMHPLIFAAGMGVPIVGLGYNAKFAGLFSQLGVQPRLIDLDDFAIEPQTERLGNLMRAAIGAPGDLRAAADALASRARIDVVAALHPDAAAAEGMP
jgi:polysaccharide pyruvyl transferase WcaK-like protein